MACGQPIATSVYKYFDAFGVLIYVGITSTGITRNRQHNSDKEWWPFVAQQEVEHCDSREKAHAREVELIKAFGPPFNKQHHENHKAARRAYLHMREYGQLHQAVRQLISRGGKKRLLLTAADRFANRVMFVPTVEDSALFGCMRMGGCEALDAVSFRPVGSIVEIHTDRKRAGVVVAMQDGFGEPRRAKIYLRFVSLKKPVVIEPKRIDIEFAANAERVA